MQDKVLITYVKDGERSPLFVVVNIDKIADVYKTIREMTSNPITISPVVDYE